MQPSVILTGLMMMSCAATPSEGAPPPEKGPVFFSAALADKVRASLDEQITLLTKILDPVETPREYLPPDVGFCWSLLETARVVRESNDTQQISQLTAEMAPLMRILTSFVEQKRDVHRWGLISVSILFVIAFGGIVVYLLYHLAKRRSRRQWNATINVAFWEKMLADTYKLYQTRYRVKRDTVLAIADTIGKTRILWENVTTDLDALWIDIRAIEMNTQKSRTQISSASYFQQQPLLDAITNLHTPFDFDTDTIDKEKLFRGAIAKKVRVDPLTFLNTLDSRISSLQANWEKLLQAAEIRNSEEGELLPVTRMPAIIEMAQQAGIPPAWYQDHPLIRDGKDERETLRKTDPLAYQGYVRELKEKGAQIEKRIDKMAQELTCLQKGQAETIPQFSTTMFPEDNPNITLQLASIAEREVYSVLTTACCMAGDSTMGIECATISFYAAVEEARSLFGIIGLQKIALRDAIQDVPQEIRKLEDALATLCILGKRVADTVTLAQQKYIQAKGLEVLVKSGSDQEQAARDLLTEAKEFLEKNNHLAALRLTEQGQNFVQHIRNVYDIILAFGARLDQDCKRFEIKFAEMRQIRKDAQTKVQQCKGNTASISDLIAPVIEEQGPLDYISLMADLIRQEHNWNECVKRFQKASDPLCGGNLSR